MYVNIRLLAIIVVVSTVSFQLPPLEDDDTPSSPVKSSSEFMCTYNVGGNFLTCRSTISCEVRRNNKLSAGEYLFGTRYIDKHQNIAIDLYKKVVKSDVYGAGFWHNEYPNPEDECKKYHHMDQRSGSGETRLTVLNGACFLNLTQMIDRQRTKSIRLFACCSCDCKSRYDVLYQDRNVTYNAMLKVL